MKEKNKIWRNWKLWVGIIAIIIIVIIICLATSKISKKQSITANNNVRQIKLGEIVILNNNDKELLRNITIECVKGNLKSPNSAQFEENFQYICNKENIIEVKGYVDSQNSFGAMLRVKFLCHYFAIDNDITTLVLLEIDNNEVLNIEDYYIEKQKEKAKLNEIKKSGNQISQDKLEYIKEEFNEDNANGGVGRITNVFFDEKESTIDVKLTPNSSEKSDENKKYWLNFNICSILDYIKEFDIIGTIKMTMYDINDNKVLEITFDDDFIKNTWKNNNQIDKIEELFGENYKRVI